MKINKRHSKKAIEITYALGKVGIWFNKLSGIVLFVSAFILFILSIFFINFIWIAVILLVLAFWRRRYYLKSVASFNRFRAVRNSKTDKDLQKNLVNLKRSH